MSDAGLVPVKSLEGLSRQFTTKNLWGVSVFGGFENWTIQKKKIWNVLEIQFNQIYTFIQTVAHSSHWHFTQFSDDFLKRNICDQQDDKSHKKLSNTTQSGRKPWQKA